MSEERIQNTTPQHPEEQEIDLIELAQKFGPVVSWFSRHVELQSL